MTLSDWLAENPHGPYEVGIFTVMPDEDPADLTAGRLVMTVSDVLVEGDAIIFYQNNSDSQESKFHIQNPSEIKAFEP